jgi:hypothetical protein
VGTNSDAREASQWTQPLQAAVSAFFVVGAAVNTVIVLRFGDLYRNYYAELYRRTQQVAPDQVGRTVEATVTLVTVFTLAVAIAFLGLAALSYFRRSGWVFIADMFVLFMAGAPSLVGGLINLVSPPRLSSLPQVFGLTQLVLAGVALSLFILMLGLSLRYGMWAQQPLSPPAAATAE